MVVERNHAKVENCLHIRVRYSFTASCQSFDQTRQYLFHLFLDLRICDRQVFPRVQTHLNYTKRLLFNCGNWFILFFRVILSIYFEFYSEFGFKFCGYRHITRHSEGWVNVMHIHSCRQTNRNLHIVFMAKKSGFCSRHVDMVIVFFYNFYPSRVSQVFFGMFFYHTRLLLEAHCDLHACEDTDRSGPRPTV